MPCAVIGLLWGCGGRADDFQRDAMAARDVEEEEQEQERGQEQEQED
jgi:hypothetical protein